MKLRNIFMSSGVALMLCCCTDQDSDREFVMRMLTESEWFVEEAWVGGDNVTLEYNQFTISFSNSDFRTRNYSGVWPAEGTWEFEEGTSRAIVRNDGIIVEIRQIDEHCLVLSGNWDAIIITEGRVKQVMTAHTFRFKHRP